MSRLIFTGRFLDVGSAEWGLGDGFSVDHGDVCNIGGPDVVEEKAKGVRRLRCCRKRGRNILVSWRYGKRFSCFGVVRSAVLDYITLPTICESFDGP